MAKKSSTKSRQKASKRKSSQKKRASDNGAPNPSMKFLKRTHSAVRSHLSGTTDLPTFLATTGVLSLANRRRIVEQALILLEDTYVHLPLKESMHGVDPVQRLRLLKHRLDQATPSTMGVEHVFHQQMLEIFNSVRDLHTNYLLPVPFADKIAFLPFDVEEYFEDKKPHYIASHFVQGFSPAHFEPGVEITLWNGTPISRAIEVIADRHAGSNSAARHVRGIGGLTARPLRRSLPPDELFVLIGYTDLSGTERELRQDWLVSPPMPDAGGVDHDSGKAASALQGLDLEMDLVRQMKKLLFAPKVVAEEKKPVRKFSLRRASAGESIHSSLPSVFEAKSVETPSGVFGYIRIFTFSVDDPDGFIREFIRLAELLPQDGLILDVRGNGGGHIWASEGLLQILTPQEIQPEPTQFINTPLNLRICDRHKGNPVGIDLGPWVDSIKQSVETGAVYSRGFPITPTDFANQFGQKYHGPVVLITDARCYSATDIFAAGFQDHEIGPIVGIDDNTGAGGANVWTHGLLQQLLRIPSPSDAESPFKNLPDGAGMRVSIRRTLRVGDRSGTPVEDLGVVPDQRYFMSKNDLLNGNEDMIRHVAKILAGLPVRKLQVDASVSGSVLTLDLSSQGISSLDIYLDGRPVKSIDLTDGDHTLSLDMTTSADRLELAGYFDGEYVAARRVDL